MCNIMLASRPALLFLANLVGSCCTQATIFENLQDLTEIDLSQTQLLDGVKFRGNEFGDGQELELPTVQEEPQVNYKGSEEGNCTLLMVDPDAPSRQAPKFRCVRV